MLTNLQRIVKAGWLNFWRNKLLSFATLAVMTLVLFVVAGLLLLNVMGQSLVKTLENRIDVSVYFKTNVVEKDVLAIKDILEDFTPVAAVNYISREQALEKFKDENYTNETYMQSLQVLGDNPLGASLSIKAHQPSEYAFIVAYLEKANFKDFVDKIDFRQNEAAINKLISISGGVKKTGLIISLFLALVAVLVTFNTIRLAIYNQKEEITVKRLVGASNWSIRGPFLVTGIIYGLVGSLVTLLVCWPAVALASPRLASIFSELNLLTWFETNTLGVWLILLGVGLVLGLTSSMIAIRKYLKV